MARIKLTVLKSQCRGGYHRVGETFVVDDLCPPLCHELWHAAYPFVYALQNGAQLDAGDARAAMFEVSCPDGGRVRIRGERLEDK